MAGRRRPTRMAIIAKITNNSISVKPDRSFDMEDFLSKESRDASYASSDFEPLIKEQIIFLR
jgi:hypothetical protein